MAKTKPMTLVPTTEALPAVVPLESYMKPGRVPVLIAEDSEDNRFLLEAFCKGTCYDVTFAENGEEAVAAFREGAFQLVVMDIQMPVLDGLAATRQIRDLESSRGAGRTPILALTANVMPSDVESAQQAGCDVHLSKPISRKGFLSALDDWKPKALNIG
jgi:CheY-like chemotaxis protein